MTAHYLKSMLNNQLKNTLIL